MPDLARNLIQRINIGDSLTRTAAANPDQIAIVHDDRRWTYREFNLWVNRLVHGMREKGFARGDAIGLAAGNSAEFLAVYYACAKLGAVCVPMNLGWRAEEMAYALRHSRSRALVVEADLLPKLQEALVFGDTKVQEVFVIPDSFGLLHTEHEGEPEFYVEDTDPLTYLYTSGTTSSPKGVMGSHKALYLQSMSGALDSGWRSDDRFAAMMPMFHTAQLNAFCTPAMMIGATIHVLRGFEPEALLDMIERERITQIFGLPMMYRAMLDHPSFGQRDLSSLRRAVYAMAPMPDELIRRSLEGFGCEFALLFGQTEMSPVTTLFRPEHQLSHTGAVGTPITGVQVAIMGDGGRLLPRGEEGEIVYRGPSTMTGYLDDVEATEKAFAHGWFHSGDIGRFDEDGILWFADRSKDVIKTGGENVASIEVEKAVYAAVPGAAEVVVVGLPHDRWSEAITAFVLPKEGEEVVEADVIAALKERLDGYKVPKAVVVVDELPRTSTGKVQKNVIREQYARHYATV